MNPILTRSAFVVGLVCSALIDRAEAPASNPATQAAATIVKHGSVPMKFDATGYFEAIDPMEVRIRPKSYAGELAIATIVPNGATVKKGDKLLEIDPAPLKRQLQAADGEAAVAHANLTKAEADAKIAEGAEALALRIQQDGVKDAEEGVKWWEDVDGPQMLKMSELQVKQVQAGVDDSSDELEQLKKMYKTEELTSATADIVVKRAVRGLEIGRQHLEMTRKQADKTRTFLFPASKRRVYDALPQAQQALASLEAVQAQSKVVRQTGLVAARAAVVAAEQKVSDLHGDLDKLTVIAPADGIVWYGQLAQGNWASVDPKTMRVGEKVAAQQTLMTLYTPGKLRVVIDLAESKYFAVPAGTKATATPVAFPEMRIEGACEGGPKTPVTTPTGQTYPLPINGADVDPRLMAGMKASVHVDVPAIEGVLVVPTSAVSGSAVWLHGKDGPDKRQTVVTGRTDGKVIEIVSGVREGDVVLTQAKP